MLLQAAAARAAALPRVALPHLQSAACVARVACSAGRALAAARGGPAAGGCAARALSTPAAAASAASAAPATAAAAAAAPAAAPASAGIPLTQELPGIPKLKPARNLPPPAVRVTTLSNGLRVATQETYSQVSCMALFMDAGSMYESGESIGETPEVLE